MKTQQPKITMENLNWARGDETGVVPYVFNKNRTAIKLYHEDFNFEILQLRDIKGMSDSQKALDACAAHFGENFYNVMPYTVFEGSFSEVEQVVRFIFAGGCSADEIPFSEKDISIMRKKYNKLLERTKLLNERIEKKHQAKKAEQDAIMDF